MDNSWLERTELLLGEEKLTLLRNANVLVVGLGGVGAYAAEMIARAGVGKMTIADADTVSKSNINRQLIALHSTIGQEKSALMAQRLRDINPEIELQVINRFIKDDETDALLDSQPFDYVVDAIDTLSPKLALIKGALVPWELEQKPIPQRWRYAILPRLTIARWHICYASDCTKSASAQASKRYFHPKRSEKEQ